VAALVFLAVAGLIGTFIFFRIPDLRQFPFMVGRLLAGGIALACWAALVMSGVKAYLDESDNARITTEGIEVKNRIYLWESIGDVYSIKLAKGVMIQFDLRDMRDSSKKSGFVLHMPTRVLMSPFLTPEEFQQLLDDLTAEVLPQHPHLKLDPVPRNPH
jgi:hypothetical protein